MYMSQLCSWHLKVSGLFYSFFLKAVEATVHKTLLSRAE